MACCAKPGAEFNCSKPVKTDEEAHASVQEYYGKVLQKTSDLQTSCCTLVEPPSKIIKECLSVVPDEILAKFYGCGTPLPTDIEGLRVLDLGCGAGQDCYVAAKLVGPRGTVTGIDMTPEQLEVAGAHAYKYCTETLKYPTVNLKFVEGMIEDLESAGVKAGSVDLVISNCVVNLSPRKDQVINGVFRALAEGGEFHFSDIYCDRRLPAAIKQHPLLLGECIGGALYIREFISLCRAAGFAAPRALSVRPFAIDNEELRKLVGAAQFYSITFRCFKLPSLEETEEDYGQVAYYLGTHPEGLVYKFDSQISFETGRPVLVSGNTAAMLSQARLAPHFRIEGSRDTHFGPFRQASNALPC